MKLTAKRIDRLRKKPGKYGDGYGLILQVRNPNNMSWLFRFERSGRERVMGLGPLHTLTLKEAREKARGVRQLLLDGIDLLDQRKAQRTERALAAAKSLTFEAAARQYYNQHKGQWKNLKHAKQFIASLQSYAFPKIGRLAVADVDTGEVLKVLEQELQDYDGARLWDAVPETADRLRGRIERVLDWASVRGYRKSDAPIRHDGKVIFPKRCLRAARMIATIRP